MRKEIYFDRDLTDSESSEFPREYWNHIYNKYKDKAGENGLIRLDEDDMIYVQFNYHGRQDDTLSIGRRKIWITEENDKLKIYHTNSIETVFPMSTEVFSVQFGVNTEAGHRMVLETATTEPLYLEAGDELIIKSFYFFVDKL